MNVSDTNTEQLLLTSAKSAHQVLARKWRPRNFEQMVGQEHVLRALINALNSHRIHHAYLFTGTRGIGKTTVSRILAKCLNCEQGISAIPCGSCSICTAIDQGKFVDLLEVDAASRTKVEDTRELLENVQYAPTQGRYKVYLIDEVHMLSGHSFNALLKTLEEPPPHIKFLLATTDPQRLPVTILSRCLQFHLKRLPPERIAAHLANILQQEVITYDQTALQLLSKAADGSMRDALSLLDQAIAYGGGHVSEQEVSAMLGAIEQTYIWDIIAALIDNNPQALLDCCQQLAENAADFTQALEELISCFHQLAVAQALPAAFAEANVTQYAQRIPGEELQLYYQIGLIGRRDLPLAPTPRIGFEMVLLRMLSYQPTRVEQPKPGLENNKATSIPHQPITAITPSRVPKEPAEKLRNTEPVIPTQPALMAQTVIVSETAPVLPPEAKPITSNSMVDIAPQINDASNWLELLSRLELSGLSYTLASHCVLKELSDQHVHLLLDSAFSAMLSPKLQQNLNEAFNQYFGKSLRLIVDISTQALETPAAIQKRLQSEQHEAAVSALHNDPLIQQLTRQFDAKLELSTIKLK